MARHLRTFCVSVPFIPEGHMSKKRTTSRHETRRTVFDEAGPAGRDDRVKPAIVGTDDTFDDAKHKPAKGGQPPVTRFLRMPRSE